MRLLFTIPHYVRPAGVESYSERRHGALDSGAATRVEALAACLSALHRLFRTTHPFIHHASSTAHAVSAGMPCTVDAVVCTTRGHHVLDQLPTGAGPCTHEATAAVTELLGFACHDVLRDRLGGYDYYCYLEDDLVLHDPLFFRKLAWFDASAGWDKLLQPNRFEAGAGFLVTKVYVDGDIARHCTAPFVDWNDAQPISLPALGVNFAFERAANPHSGCFFLTARQMEHWARQRHFTDRASRFMGPLETAATLGIMRTFKIFKPAPLNADFLEIQHHGTGYLAQLCPPPAPMAKRSGAER